MPFHPPILSPAVLRDLAKNLAKGSNDILSTPLVLNQAQELLARALGHPDWHAAQTCAHRLSSQAAPAEKSAGPAPIDLKALSSCWNRIVQGRHVVLNGGLCLEGEEIVAAHALLPVFVWKLEQTGAMAFNHVSYANSDESWCMIELHQLIPRANHHTFRDQMALLISQGLNSGEIPSWHDAFEDAFLNDGLPTHWQNTPAPKAKMGRLRA